MRAIINLFSCCLVCVILTSCAGPSSIRKKIDEQVSKVALPVSESSRVAIAVGEAFVVSDLNLDGKVPSNLDELIFLIQEVFARYTAAGHNTLGN